MAIRRVPPPGLCGRPRRRLALGLQGNLPGHRGGERDPSPATVGESPDLLGELVLATPRKAGRVNLAVRRRVLREPPIQGRPVEVAWLDGLLAAADRPPPDAVEGAFRPG